MKKVAVLGSTGSIGTQTLDVVRANDDLEVVGLAAGSNVEMLEKQIREFHPRLVAVWKEEAARDLAVRVQDLDVKIVSQMGGLIELARMEESDILVTAIVGMIGIRPTMEAILAGKDIALANKETLVTAGHLIMPLAKQFGVQILPVDSEHSAIFQALHGEKREQIHKLLITASGGPFRGKKTADLEKVTLDDIRNFGMIPEFIGRLPIIFTLRGLDEEMLVKILKEPKNAILKQYQKLLALDEVQLDFDEEALHTIARKAMEKKTGARALRAIIEDFMLDIMYEIPKDDNIGKVTITSDYIEHKGGPVITMRGVPALESQF